MPLEPKTGTKCKLTGTTHPDQPEAKKGIPTGKTKTKPDQPKATKDTLPSKKAPPRKLSKPCQPKMQPHPKNVSKKRKLGHPFQTMSNLIRIT